MQVCRFMKMNLCLEEAERRDGVLMNKTSINMQRGCQKKLIKFKPIVGWAGQKTTRNNHQFMLNDGI